MELVSGSHIPDSLIAAMTLLSEKPRQGVPSWNLAPIQGITEANCTAGIGLRFGCSKIVSGTVVAPNKPGCVNANFAQRAVVSVLSKVAQWTGLTVGYGVGGSIGVGKAPLGVTLSASQQLLVSPDGTAGLATSFTPLPFSLSTTGVGGLVGVQITGNVNKTFMDNGGVGLDAGAMFADGIGGGADVSNSGFTLTGGVGIGGYGHGGTATYTVATPFCPS